jgi:hypothetical protein
MERRTFLTGAGAVLLAAPLAAEAQPARKVYKIGSLNPGLSSESPGAKSPFRLGLHDLGHVEGRDRQVIGSFFRSPWK